jgi:hypothetical protein
MEQIAMLNGLGAYGENPIGDLDPRIAAARTAALRTTAVPNAYQPVPYTLQGALGAAGDACTTTDGKTGKLDANGACSAGMNWWLWGGAAVLALVGIDWWMKQSGKSGLLPKMAFNGFEEPMMLSSLSPKKRRSRKGRK